MHPENFTDPEAALLGCILLDNKTAPEIRLIVSTEDFRDLRHRAIYSTITKMLDAKEGADLSTVYAKLDAEGNLKTAGDADYLGSLLDACHNVANATTYAKAVKAKSDRRRKKSAAEMLSKSLDGRDDPDATEKIRALIDQTSGPVSAGKGLTDTEVSSFAVCNKDLPKIPSLLGDGIIARGCFSVLHGPEGLGKTWLALQLGYAVATGMDWLGMKTERARTLYVGTEMNEWVAKHRIIQIARLSVPPNIAPIFGTDDFVLQISPNFTDRIDLADATEAERLAAYVRDRKFDLVIIDPWSDFHSLDENSNTDMSLVMSGVAKVMATGAHVMAIHHDRKPAQGVESDTARGRMRGASKVRTSATTVFALSEESGRIKLEVAKTNFCGNPPEPIWLIHEEDGGCVPTSAPEVQAKARDNRIYTVICELVKFGVRGATMSDLMESAPIKEAGISSRTVRNYLDQLAADGKATAEGDKKGRKYRAIP